MGCMPVLFDINQDKINEIIMRCMSFENPQQFNVIIFKNSNRE